MTKLLSDETHKKYDVILSQSLCCKARDFNRLIINGDMDETAMIETEVFLRMGCPELFMLTRLYDDLCVRREQARKDLENPTKTEEDRRRGE